MQAARHSKQQAATRVLDIVTLAVAAGTPGRDRRDVDAEPESLPVGCPLSEPATGEARWAVTR